MIHDPQHTLTDLEVLPPLGLRLTFADGTTLSVDLAPTICIHRALAALADPALFAKARLDSRGGYVVWIEDDLEMAADNLRNLAVEQAGGIGHERLANWMAEHGLTQERAADAVGISRRMLNYYLAGSRRRPRRVGRSRRAAAARKAAWVAGIPHTFGRTFNSGWGRRPSAVRRFAYSAVGEYTDILSLSRAVNLASGGVRGRGICGQVCVRLLAGGLDRMLDCKTDPSADSTPGDF